MKCLLLVKEVPVTDQEGYFSTYRIQEVELENTPDTFLSVEGYSFDWGKEVPLIVSPNITYQNIEKLTGQVLTLLDAVLSEDKRCTATKQLAKSTIKRWYRDIASNVDTRLESLISK